MTPPASRLWPRLPGWRRGWHQGLIAVALGLLVTGFALGHWAVLGVLAEGLAPHFGWQVRVQGAAGTLWGEGHLGTLEAQGPGLQLRLQGLRSSALLGTAPTALRLDALHLQSHGPSEARLDRAGLQALLHTRLHAPWQLQLSPVAIGRLAVDGHALHDLQAHLDWQGRSGHLQLRVDRLQPGTPQPAPQGPKHEAAAAPLPHWSGQLALDATGRLQARVQHSRLQGAVELRGDLDALHLHADLRLRAERPPHASTQPPSPSPSPSPSAPRLTADLRLTPFGPQGQAAPRLQGQAAWSALDPATWWPGAPTGLWDGQLCVDAEQRWTLAAHNAAARRLDQQGWPLRRLDAAWQWQAQDARQVRLDRLQLELGSSTEAQPAGRLRLAAPLRWDADTRQAPRTALLLENLQPQRLDARWPALQVDARLQLQPEQAATPPTLRLHIDTQARLQATDRHAAGQRPWTLDARLHLQHTPAADSPSGKVNPAKAADRAVPPPPSWQLQAEEVRLGRDQTHLRLQGELTHQGPHWRSAGEAQLERLQGQAGTPLAGTDLSASLGWAVEHHPERALTARVNAQLLPGSRWLQRPVHAQLDWQQGVQGGQLKAEIKGESQDPAPLRVDLAATLPAWPLRPSPRPSLPPGRSATPAAATDRTGLALHWNLPRLDLLAPVLAAATGQRLEGLTGRSSGSLQSHGSRWLLGADPALHRDAQGWLHPQNWQLQLEAAQLGLRHGGATHRLQQAQLRWDPSTRSGSLQLDALDTPTAGLGSLAQARAEWRPALWQLAAHGRSTQDIGWRLTGQAEGPSLDLGALLSDASPAPGSAASPAAALQLTLDVQPQARQAAAQRPSWSVQLDSRTLQLTPNGLRLGPSTLALAGEPLQVAQAAWQWRPTPGTPAPPAWHLQLQGQPRVAAWLAVLAPQARWAGDARWDVQLQAQAAPSPSTLRLQSLQGDLLIDGQALGLRQLQAQVQQASTGALQAELAWEGQRIGQGRARWLKQPDGSLDGQLQAAWPELQTLRPWLPAGLLLEGALRADVQLSGTRQKPRWHGQLQAELARLQHPPSGLGVQQVQLRAELQDDRLQLSDWRAQGQGEGGGQLRGQGSLRWGEGLEAELQWQAERLRVLARFDRRLSLSGPAQLRFDAQGLHLRGRLRADEGLFTLGSGDAPGLDDDVSVQRSAASPETGAGPATAPATKPPTDARLAARDIDLQFDLGEALRVQGRGLNTRLSGRLNLRERSPAAARWTGQIETQGGRYRAYGQQLDLERGVLRFTGALDNPQLDLLALRPDIEHRVGVSVAGSAAAPRVRLFAEPELPDTDKLAWLLLGRDPADMAGRDAALLQRAALSLMAGEGESPTAQLMDRLGLTELSLSPGDDAGAVLRLGTQLSRRWSLGYERSLNAASGNWQLVYRLGQRFRLRTQSGSESAVDLLWLWRFDG